jgi:PncC family amidohydrolase
MKTSLSFEVVSQLAEKKLTLATAESCTGGWIGRELTAVPGSSGAYLGGVISYTNGVKEKLLGVPAEMLETCGAVSAPVAAAMANGAREAIGADLAVSVTGLAGPGGDTFGNPVGTVFLGFADANGAIWEKHLFAGSREEVRFAACQRALVLILEHING